MDLFTDAARIDKQEKLDRAADALRRRFGGAAVTRATLLTPDTRKPEALSAAKEREKEKKVTGAAARITGSGHPRTAARGQSMAASIDKQVYYAYNTLKAQYRTGKGGGTLGKFQRAAIS